MTDGERLQKFDADFEKLKKNREKVPLEQLQTRYADAYNALVAEVQAGADWFADTYINLLVQVSIPGDLGGIKNDTGAIKRSVAMSEEDIKMLVDMAERKYINNVNLTAQTPVINVHGQNTGNSEADAVWLADTLQRMLIEQAASHTDLSYT